MIIFLNNVYVIILLYSLSDDVCGKFVLANKWGYRLGL